MQHKRFIHKRLYCNHLKKIVTITSKEINSYETVYCFDDFLDELPADQYISIPRALLPMHYIKTIRQQLNLLLKQGYTNISSTAFNEISGTIMNVHIKVNPIRGTNSKRLIKLYNDTVNYSETFVASATIADNLEKINSVYGLRIKAAHEMIIKKYKDLAA